MKAQEILDNFNAMRPTDNSDETLLGWIKELDMLVMEEIIKKHEINEGDIAYKEEEDFDINKWFDDWGMNSDLLIPEPYTDLYIYFLDTKEKYRVNDMNTYNRVVVLYNNAYLTFQQYYNRTHMPLQGTTFWIDHETL
jgi:hypothetical protein